MASKSPVVLSVPEWQETNVRFMQPKVNDRGGKSISIISGQSNRGLHISLPLLNTWGISDYVDEKTGESDGKYSISLSFPSEEYATAGTREALQKLKNFENHILDMAVSNAEVWWGEPMSREVAKHTFFPFLKYSKNKDTKRIDLTKPPTIRAKVPMYDGQWNVEIYNTKAQMIFPAGDASTPMDHIPPRSQVACVLQCGGIWIGGKGWGLTWKLFQCVVKKNQQAVALKGVCNVVLDPSDMDVDDEPAAAAAAPIAAAAAPVAVVAPVAVAAPAVVSPIVDDDGVDAMDVDTTSPPVSVPVVQAPAPVVEPPAPPAAEAAAAAAPVKKVVKRVVKKAADA
jgi:hypothetical protein